MFAEQRVRATIDKFVSNVDSCLLREIDIPHPKAIACVESARIPQQRCRLGASIGSRKRGKRKRAVTIVAAPRGHRGNQCMPQAVTETAALTAVVKRVFAEQLSQSV